MVLYSTQTEHVFICYACEDKGFTTDVGSHPNGASRVDALDAAGV
jgi:hypothetical protein